MLRAKGADLNVLSKLGNQGLKGVNPGIRGEVRREDDLLMS
jgi:hypothetical protein